MEEYNEEIFNYLKPQDNTLISTLNNNDLLDLIILINNCNLILRDNIDLTKDITFGLELEFEDIQDKTALRKITDIYPDNDWGKIKIENSLYHGAEISSPILTDTKENWQDLDKVCTFISKLATIDKSAGGHIHIGAHLLGSNKTNWLNFFKLWSTYENIIFRFSYGEYLTHRRNIDLYAKPISAKLSIYRQGIENTDFNLAEIIEKLGKYRQQAINFRNVFTQDIDTQKERNTIEFRCPNGTINPIIWQNNVSFFAKLLLYCKSTNFNNDILDKRYQINDHRFYNLKWYDEIFLEQALELTDLIFDNNKDKIYFLKQYLKKFKTYTENEPNKQLTLFKKE